MLLSVSNKQDVIHSRESTAAQVYAMPIQQDQLELKNRASYENIGIVRYLLTVFDMVNKLLPTVLGLPFDQDQGLVSLLDPQQNQSETPLPRLATIYSGLTFWTGTPYIQNVDVLSSRAYHNGIKKGCILLCRLVSVLELESVL